MNSNIQLYISVKLLFSEIIEEMKLIILIKIKQIPDAKSYAGSEFKSFNSNLSTFFIRTKISHLELE